MTENFTRTICTQDCSDVCGLLVRPGERSAVRGDPDHPFTAGFVCSRVKGIFHRLQSVERVLKPRLRVKSGWEDMSGLWGTELDKTVFPASPPGRLEN
jgi:anaerobic selenocysteine-containing dehydrogenase